MNRLTRAWRRLTRDRVTDVLAIHDKHEQAIRQALHAEAERVFPGDGGPWEPWMNGCDPHNPCGTRWNSNADRAEWQPCASHPGGKHHRLSIVHTPPYDDSLTEKFSIADYSQVIELHERRRP